MTQTNPTKECELLLIRHAQCEGNRAGQFSSIHQDPLTTLGKQQAASLHRFIKNQGIIVDQLYTSPAARAISTAEIIFPEMTAQQDQRLHEINAGSFSQTTHEQKQLLIPSHICEFIDKPFPDGESYRELYTRVVSWFKSISLAPNRKIAVVAHGGSIGMILHFLIDDKLAHFPLFQLDNASLTRIVLMPDLSKFFFKEINFKQLTP